MNFWMKVLCFVFGSVLLLTLCLFDIISYHSIPLAKRNNPTARTTEKVMLDASPSSICPPQYDGFCMNEGQCYFPVEVNQASCLCKTDYGGRRCEKYLWYY